MLRDDSTLARVLRERDAAGWELVTAADAGRGGSALFCFRRPR